MYIIIKKLNFFNNKYIILLNNKVNGENVKIILSSYPVYLAYRKMEISIKNN